jgi:hypothetical protein
MQIIKDVLCSILRSMQKSGEPFKFVRDFLDDSIGKADVDFHLKHLMDDGLINAEVRQGIGPKGPQILVRGLTPAGHRYLETECQDAKPESGTLP